MLSALKADGQPAETTWPYLDALPTDSSGYGPPSNVTVFRRDGEPRRECLDEIIARLDANKPVLVLMMLSDAFYLPNNEGVITAPASEQPDPLRRHAVVAVGYGQIGGARAILIRNSWGKDWGVAGHAWLPEAFIAPRLTRVALLTEEIHVPTKNLAA
jgi:C1A family cysteine protease